MRSTTIRAAVLAALAIPAVAFAQSAPAIKTGQMVTSGDGKRVGRVYDIDKAKDGSVASVVIIRDSKIIRIAASTLTSSDKGLTTSLSNADVAKLK